MPELTGWDWVMDIVMGEEGGYLDELITDADRNKLKELLIKQE